MMDHATNYGRCICNSRDLEKILKREILESDPMSYITEFSWRIEKCKGTGCSHLQGYSKQVNKTGFIHGSVMKRGYIPCIQPKF